MLMIEKYIEPDSEGVGIYFSKHDFAKNGLLHNCEYDFVDLLITCIT